MANVLNHPARARVQGFFTRAVDVTPGSSELSPNAEMGLHVGTGGDVEITTSGGDTTVLHNVPDGTWIPGKITHVLATNTTASDIVALS